jgi:Protein of unknown function (DUF3570)
MQLRPGQGSLANTRRRLIVATCALLGTAGARGQEASPAPPDSGLLEDWAVDSAVAYYREDGRIQAIEPVVEASKIYASGQTLSFNATFDSLSGSSPNGALPSHIAQTFTGPSGKSSHNYTTAPGELPADPHYEDTRGALGANWTLPISRADQLTLGAKLSGEDDFVSVTVNASVAHDFNEKNTTLSVGISNEYDSLSPIGGAPVPGSNYSLAEKAGGESKNGIGLLLGLTQVMTRDWLSEVNLSLDRFTGYLNDPYKITSIIDGAGVPIGYVYENRPDQRTRASVYWENRVAWNARLSTALSLRYMADDWGVRSDTAQLHVRWLWADRAQYLEPIIRWYRQTAADFYTPFIVSETATPAAGYEASDSRLGPFHALTFGLKYALKLPGVAGRDQSEFSVRAEYYRQTLDEQTVTLAGLQGLDLYPGLKAVLVQVGWRF